MTVVGNPPSAFLDASVLYPALTRDLLMRLALRDLFHPHWSAQIHDEWTRAVLRNRPDLPRAKIERTRRLMDEEINDANVSGYEHRLEGIELPDIDDRHVLAAAIHCGASILVTANLRDFPASTLARHDIEAQHPDVFILGLFNRAPRTVCEMLRETRATMKNPPFTAAALLAAMSRHGLAATAEALSSFEDSL